MIWRVIARPTSAGSTNSLLVMTTTPEPVFGFTVMMVRVFSWAPLWPTAVLTRQDRPPFRGRPLIEI